MVPGTSAVIAELQGAGVGLTALTNWSGETFPVAHSRFGILRRFADIVVSGDEKLLKPDPAIFALACERAGIAPEQAVFVDDSAANVAAATSFGLTGLRFVDAEGLRADLVRLDLLDARAPIGRSVFHWALRTEWNAAGATGEYVWSSRGTTYDAEGFVHCSFAEQVDRTRRRYYADLADDELVLLELGPDGRDLPIVVEPGGDESFPHLFAPLPVGMVRAHPGDWRP
jgi:2-haloacid dehalogenase